MLPYDTESKDIAYDEAHLGMDGLIRPQTRLTCVPNARLMASDLALILNMFFAANASYCSKVIFHVHLHRDEVL